MNDNLYNVWIVVETEKGYQDMSWLGVSKDEFETFYGNITDKIVQIEMRLIEMGI